LNLSFSRVEWPPLSWSGGISGWGRAEPATRAAIMLVLKIIVASIFVSKMTLVVVSSKGVL